jgi:hypothetical protein
MRMSVIASVTSHRLLDLTDVRSRPHTNSIKRGEPDTEFADLLRDNVVISFPLHGLFIQSLHLDSIAKEPS